MTKDDPHNLARFITAQEPVYPAALAELKSGQKRTHWMWFIFPQVTGLGFSPTSQYYAIHSLEEAQQYLAHPVLGTRLRECAEAVLAVEGRSASQIFGYPDDLKLKSSMTLFAQAADTPDSPFARVLEQYFQGERDAKTLNILGKFKRPYGLCAGDFVVPDDFDEPLPENIFQEKEFPLDPQ